MNKGLAIHSNNPLIISSEASGETIIGTTGLVKKILHKGVSWQTPIPGDEVEVHYNVSLQKGDYFDSSREKRTPFRFKLGQSEVIKGLDEGIGSMRKGERAIFIIPPELGYGEAECHQPIIPPNSTLIFDVELITWYPIRDISGDGGIMKKITGEGQGWATPTDGDEVFVKYVAKCENGSVISKSEHGIHFSLTSGHLCPAMSIAVKTMRKGEKAELSVKLSYGIMHRENRTSAIDANIQHYQSLSIHLQLVSWRAVVDINGDNKILKKIMNKGEAFDRPSDGTLVKVVYIGKLEDGTIIERQGTEEEPFEYMCGEEQVPGGLDRAVMTMRKGEEAIVKISSDLFDSTKVGAFISSAEYVLYEIKLIDLIKEKPFWKMDARERITECETKKNEGNTLFKAGKFQLASKKYDKEFTITQTNTVLSIFNTLQASTCIEYCHLFTDCEKIQANTLRLSCYLNNAACKLKLGEYQHVSRLCTKVLELDPHNVKALFRRSQAYMRISDLEKAEEDINRALLIDPSNKEVKIKHKELKEKQRQYVNHEAKMYSTIISRIG